MAFSATARVSVRDVRTLHTNTNDTPHADPGDAHAHYRAKEDPRALAVEARALLERTALTRELPAFFTADTYAEHLVRGVQTPG